MDDKSFLRSIIRLDAPASEDGASCTITNRAGHAADNVQFQNVLAYLEIEELSKKLDRGLRTVLLYDRHVHVVHEDHNLRLS